MLETDSGKRNLVVVAVFAVVLSLISLLLSLSLLSAPSPTAHATSNGTGKVTIEIPQVLSISLSNSTVDFGSCAINMSKNYSVLDSSLGPQGADNSACEGGYFPSHLVVENKGNLNANVSVHTNFSSAEFFQGSPSWYAYKILNNPDRPGCTSGSLQDSYTNFSSTDSYLACDNLSWTPGNDSMLLAVKAVVYPNTTTKKAASITFEARSID